MGMEDFSYSLQMRDTIRRMTKEALDSERPRYRYAKVVSFERVARKCTIIYNGEENPVIVNMGSVQPKQANQIVRVEGIGTDKFITDVMGDPWFDPANLPAPPTPYTTPDTGWQSITLSYGTALGGVEAPQYRIRDGVVYFSVGLTGAVAANQLLATLPVEARPARNFWFVGNYAGGFIEVKITTTGQIVVGAGTANGCVVTGSYPLG